MLSIIRGYFLNLTVNVVLEERRKLVIQNITLLDKKINQRLSLECILLGDIIQLLRKIVKTITTYAS